MKSIILLLGSFIFSSVAFGTTCVFKGITMLAETHKIEIEECWQLVNWPNAKAKTFCQEKGQGEGMKVKFCQGSTCSCRAGSSGRCDFTQKASQGLSEDYFKKNNIPPSMRKQIEANMKMMAAQKSPYDGLQVKLFYYPGQLLDKNTHLQDCKNKGGIFHP